MLISIFLMILIFTGCSDTASKDGKENKTYQLKLAHFFPSTHPVETELVQPWAKAVEEATNGKVKITSFPGETLLKAGGTYDGVVKGVADMGISCFAYNRGRFPVMEAFELPGITYNNSRVASKVAWEGVKELKPREVQDTKLMMLLATGPGDLMTKKPVQNLNELQGMEIRATGLSAKTLKALGSAPVAMPQSETYEALSKGVVEGNLGPVEVLEGWKHGEVTDYITKTPFLYNTLFYMTMNKDKWNSLPEDIQEKIKEVNNEIFENAAMGLWDSQNESAVKWAVNKTGQEIFSLSEEQKKKWINKVEPIQNEYVSKMDQKDIDGERVLKKVKKLSIKYNKEFK
ncbi:MAG: TRAP transporter substrate-binding protein [Clostridiales bacterium]|nr:TRAP transporter substrate-binding protein [Clostridiales bacterium]MCF8022768.1 TRAP transporter substrate-binding protein [Clostridiales bacterium]